MGAVGPDKVMRVLARGMTTFAVTPYLCRSRAAPMVSVTTAALAGP